MRQNKRAKLELTAVYFTALLLMLALTGVVSKISAANGQDPYPNLRVSHQEQLQPAPANTVYFTFDDGVSQNTNKILDMLQQQDVKATFFVTAQNADQPYAAETLRRIVNEGHSLGLHTYSHDFSKIYRSVDHYLADLDRLNGYIYETVGIYPDIFRFPGGSATVSASPAVMKALIRELTARGYQYYDWDVVSGDDTATVYAPEYLAQNMLRGVEEGKATVILLHDNATPVTSAQAVDLVINHLRERGFVFDRLTAAIEPVHIQSERLR